MREFISVITSEKLSLRKSIKASFDEVVRQKKQVALIVLIFIVSGLLSYMSFFGYIFSFLGSFGILLINRSMFYNAVTDSSTNEHIIMKNEAGAILVKIIIYNLINIAVVIAIVLGAMFSSIILVIPAVGLPLYISLIVVFLSIFYLATVSFQQEYLIYDMDLKTTFNNCIFIVKHAFKKMVIIWLKLLVMGIAIYAVFMIIFGILLYAVGIEIFMLIFELVIFASAIVGIICLPLANVVYANIRYNLNMGIPGLDENIQSIED